MVNDDRLSHPNAYAAQRAAWTERATRLGAERAPYHVKHASDNLLQIQTDQWNDVEPAITAAVTPQDVCWLDYGCGAGRWTPWLAERYDVVVIGVDLTPTLLSYAMTRRPPTAGRVQWALLGDEGRIPYAPGTFDVLFSWTVLSAIKEAPMLAATLAEWQRVTHRGSLIVLLDNTSKLGGRPVVSPWSISRTVGEYQQLLRWVDLEPVSHVVDLGDVNTLLVGRVR